MAELVFRSKTYAGTVDGSADTLAITTDLGTGAFLLVIANEDAAGGDSLTFTYQDDVSGGIDGVITLPAASSFTIDSIILPADPTVVSSGAGTVYRVIASRIRTQATAI